MSSIFLYILPFSFHYNAMAIFSQDIYPGIQQLPMFVKILEVSERDNPTCNVVLTKVPHLLQLYFLASRIIHPSIQQVSSSINASHYYYWFIITVTF